MATSYPSYQHEYNSPDYNVIEQLEAPHAAGKESDNNSGYPTHSSSYEAQMSPYPRVESSGYPSLDNSNIHDKMNSVYSTFNSSITKPQQTQSSHTPDLLGDAHETNNDPSFSSPSASSSSLSGSQPQANHSNWNKQSATPTYAAQTQAPPSYPAQSNSQPQSPQVQSSHEQFQPQQQAQQVHTISPRLPRQPAPPAQSPVQAAQQQTIQRPQSQPQSQQQQQQQSPQLHQQFQQMQVSPQEQPQGQNNLLVQQYAQQQSQMQMQQKTEHQMQQIQQTVNHQTQQAQLLLQQANVVQAYFNRIMQFMENVDRRLSHLEGLTNNVLKTQQDGATLPISTAELDSARRAQEQLEADMEFARKMQAELEREANQASRSSSVSSTSSSSIKHPQSVDHCPICARAMTLMELQNHIEGCLEQESKKDGPKKDLPDKKSLMERIFGPKATPPATTTTAQKPANKPADVKTPTPAPVGTPVPGMYPMMNFNPPMMAYPGQPQRPVSGQPPQGVQYMMVPNMPYPYYPQSYSGQK